MNRFLLLVVSKICYLSWWFLIFEDGFPVDLRSSYCCIIQSVLSDQTSFLGRWPFLGNLRDGFFWETVSCSSNIALIHNHLTLHPYSHPSLAISISIIKISVSRCKTLPIPFYFLFNIWTNALYSVRVHFPELIIVIIVEPITKYDWNIMATTRAQLTASLIL